MRRTRGRVAVFAVAVAVLLAGCFAEEPLSSDGEDDGPPATTGPATASATRGAIEGTVSSQMHEGLPGAKVTLFDEARTEVLHETSTATDASFAFSDLAPGRYAVQASRSGYQTGLMGASVEAGKVTTTNLRLSLLATLDPYTIEEDHVGMISTGRTWQVEVPGEGCVVLDVDGSLIPTCGRRNQYNSPNWRGMIDEIVDNETKTVLFEVFWSPTGIVGEHLWVDFRCDDVEEVAPGSTFDFGVLSDTDHPCYFEPETQTSPVVHRVDEPHWLEHGYNFTKWHWRVFPGYGMLGTHGLIGVDAGVAYEQPFRIHVTVFQRAPAPADFSRLPDA